MIYAFNCLVFLSIQESKLKNVEFECLICLKGVYILVEITEKTKILFVSL